jgi:hypothetical protein
MTEGKHNDDRLKNDVMNNDMNKEQWINEVMSSTKGMSGAFPADGFFERVSQKLDKPYAIRTIVLPLRQWAAAAILLLVVNIGSVAYFASNNKPDEMNGGNPIAMQMQQDVTYNY